MRSLAEYKVASAIAAEYEARALAAVAGSRQAEILIRIGAEFSSVAASAESRLVQAAANAASGSALNAISAATQLLGSSVVQSLGAVPGLAVSIYKIDVIITEAEKSGDSAAQVATNLAKEVVNAGTSAAAAFSEAAVGFISAGNSVTALVSRAGLVGIGLSLAFEGGWAIGTKLNSIDWFRDGVANLLEPLFDLLTGKTTEGLVQGTKDQFGKAEITRSPLILDLDGDGVETKSVLDGTHFDNDGNGFAEATGWVGKDDGLLVWDRNGNGKIDDGSELFGNNSSLEDGSTAANGFVALAELDTNQDGKVDAGDAAFTQLRVWKDGDSNAIVGSGELLMLGEAGVQSLGLTDTQQSVTDAQGNQHLQAGQYVTSEGIVRSMDDVWFTVDTARTVDNNLIATNDTIAALPEIAGFGNVHSLRQAMARDTSGRLQGLVESFASESDPTARGAILTTLIYAWAGVECAFRGT